MVTELPPPEPLSAPPVPGGEPHGRRRRLWVVTAVVGAVAGFVLLGLLVPESWTYLDSESGSEPLIDDNMDRGDGPFVAESDPKVLLSYEDGGYQMSLASVATGDPMGNWQAARALWSESTKRAIRVAASFDVREASSGWLIGVGCVGPRLGVVPGHVPDRSRPTEGDSHSALGRPVRRSPGLRPSLDVRSQPPAVEPGSHKSLSDSR